MGAGGYEAPVWNDLINLVSNFTYSKTSVVKIYSFYIWTKQKQKRIYAHVE